VQSWPSLRPRLKRAGQSATTSATVHDLVVAAMDEPGAHLMNRPGLWRGHRSHKGGVISARHKASARGSLTGEGNAPLSGRLGNVRGTLFVLAKEQGQPRLGSSSGLLS
jgi:hypothetical protein